MAKGKNRSRRQEPEEPVHCFAETRGNGCTDKSDPLENGRPRNPFGDDIDDEDEDDDWGEE